MAIDDGDGLALVHVLVRGALYMKRAIDSSHDPARRHRICTILYLPRSRSRSSAALTITIALVAVAGSLFPTRSLLSRSISAALATTALVLGGRILTHRRHGCCWFSELRSIAVDIRLDDRSRSDCARCHPSRKRCSSSTTCHVSKCICCTDKLKIRLNKPASQRQAQRIGNESSGGGIKMENDETSWWRMLRKRAGIRKHYSEILGKTT